MVIEIPDNIVKKCNVSQEEALKLLAIAIYKKKRHPWGSCW